MKLNKEMIDGMGGPDSEHYRKFRTLACEAYNILRKSASLLVSLFHLMAGSSIPDLQVNPEQYMLKIQVGVLVSHIGYAFRPQGAISFIHERQGHLSMHQC